MDKEKSSLGFLPFLNLLEALTRASAAVVLTISTLGLPAQAGLLEQWRFDPATNQLEITLQEGTKPRYFLLAEPPRIVLDLPNTAIGSVETQRSYSGAVRQIRVAQFLPNVTRIVLELSPEAILQPEQVQLQTVTSSRNHWVLRPLIAGFQTPTGDAASSILPPATFAPTQTVVKVPSLNRPQSSASGRPMPVTTISAPTPSSAETLPGRNHQQPSINIPTSKPPKPQTLASTVIPEIEFGQPLPSSQRQVQTKPIVPSPNGAGAMSIRQPVRQGVMPICKDATCNVSRLPVETGVISPISVTSQVTVPPLNPLPDTLGSGSRPLPSDVLPSGTVLTLRYSGEKPITLQQELPQQVVLLLKEAIRDRIGKVVAPVDTPILGRFETDSSGSRFITQTIILNGHSIPLSAQSGSLSSNQQVSQNRIEPNQILSVQLQESLVLNNHQ